MQFAFVYFNSLLFSIFFSYFGGCYCLLLFQCVMFNGERHLLVVFVTVKNVFQHSQLVIAAFELILGVIL